MIVTFQAKVKFVKNQRNVKVDFLWYFRSAAASSCLPYMQTFPLAV